MGEKAIKDKCGVFGIFGVDNPAEYTYLGLHNIQHRGQETCGIVTSSEEKKESKGHKGRVLTKKGKSFLDTVTK